MSGGGLDYLQDKIAEAINEIDGDTDYERLARELLTVVRDVVEALDYYYAADVGLGEVARAFILNYKKMREICAKWSELVDAVLEACSKRGGKGG